MVWGAGGAGALTGDCGFSSGKFLCVCVHAPLCSPQHIPTYISAGTASSLREQMSFKGDIHLAAVI